LYPFNPKAVVMHIGTNDIFDGGKSGEATATSLIDMFEAFHANLPNTTFYWYNIPNRIGQTDANKDKVLGCNQKMREYCVNNPWLVYIEQRNEVSYSGGTANPDYYRIDPNSGSQDNVHLNVKGYDVLEKLVYNAGLNITENQAQKAIDNGETPTNYVSGATSMVYQYTYGSNERNYTQNNFTKKSLIGYATDRFVYTADLTFNKVKNNAHISFSFNGRTGQRFLLWNSASNGKFHYGGQVGKTNDSSYYLNFSSTLDPYVYSAQDNKLTVSIYYDGINAYMYGDGDMKSMIVNVQYGVDNMNWIRDTFEVTTELCDVDFSNVKVIKGDVGIDKWIDSTTSNSQQLIDRFSRRGNVFVNLEGYGYADQPTQTNTENRFFDVKDVATLPTIGRHVTESPFTITDTDMSSSRSYIYLHNGNKMIKGDWTASFTFKRTSSELDQTLAYGFLSIGIAKYGTIYPWYGYHTFYQKSGTATDEYYTLHTSERGKGNLMKTFERSAGSPNSVLTADIKEFDVVVVKTDTKLYTAYIFEYCGQTYTYVATGEYLEPIMRKSTLYLALEKMTVEISNFNLSQDSSDVDSALARIGK